MKNDFHKMNQRADAERTLKQLGIQYVTLDDGRIFVRGDLKLSNRDLRRLPDLSQVHVGGNFWCDNNLLTSLEGSPASVGRGFFCFGNPLKDLAHVSRSFGTLRSGLGTFDKWEDIPAKLCPTPERLAIDEAKRSAARAEAIKDGAQLKTPLKLLKKIKVNNRLSLSRHS